GILGLDPNDPSIKTNEFTSPIDPSYDANAPYPAFSLTQAAKDWDAAGFKADSKGIRTYPGTSTEVNLTITPARGSPIHDSFMQLSANDLGNVGITLPINRSSLIFSPFAQGGLLRTGNFDVALFASSTSGDGESNTPSFDPNNIPSAANPGGG